MNNCRKVHPHYIISININVCSDILEIPFFLTWVLNVLTTANGHFYAYLQTMHLKQQMDCHLLVLLDAVLLVVLLFLRSSCTFIIKKSQEKSGKQKEILKKWTIFLKKMHFCAFFSSFYFHFNFYPSRPIEMSLGKT